MGIAAQQAAKGQAPEWFLSRGQCVGCLTLIQPFNGQYAKTDSAGEIRKAHFGSKSPSKQRECLAAGANDNIVKDAF
jgi:hypothetical protein